MNILITGIHGFVGSNLVAALKKQHTIYGLDIVSPQKDGVVKTFSWNELEQIHSVDVVIHLAGKAHDTNNLTDVQVYFDINTGLAQQIFDWYLTTNTRKFVFFSSVKAATDKVKGDVLTEDVNPDPKGPYGESKLLAEQYVLSEIPKLKSHPPIGEDENPKPANKIYILRPCMIHGPGNKGNLNLLYKLVQKGMPWPLGSFDNMRSFTSIDNLSFIIEQLISKDVDSGIYNISDDEPLSTNQLIELISQSVGKISHIWNVPKGLIYSLAKLGDFLHLPFNSFRLQKLTENYIVSNNKIKQAIGVDRLPVKASEGMVKTLAWFINN